MSVQYPALFEFPDSFETDRLIVRAVRPGDGAEVYTAILETIDDLKLEMTWADHFNSAGQVEANIRAAAAKFFLREDLRMHLYAKGDGTFVGATGLHRIDWDVPRFEIGYWIRTTQQRKGYATETVRGLTQFAFEALSAQRVEIRIFAANKASTRVAEHAGYPLETRLHSYARRNDGTLDDVLIFAMLRKDYDANSG